MPAGPFEGKESIQLADGYELDLRPRRLRRGTRALRIERIPLEILFLLVEHHGEIVSRDQIVSRIWGERVFLDTDNSIRGAIRKLRGVLKDNAESPRFIQTVTGQGYRFIAPVLEASDPVTPQNEPSVPALSPQPESAGWPRLSGPLRGLAVACVAVAVLTFVAINTRRRPAEPAPASQKTVLAIMPFENLSREPDQEFFSDGLTEEMIAQTGKLNRDRLVVVARSSVAKYKRSTLSAKEIAQELNADYVLQGSVRRLADRVRITVQLIQAQNQTAVWTEMYDRELTDVLAVQESVVRSIASQIHIELGDQDALLAGAPRLPPEAYVAYLKGRYYWNKRTGAAIEKAERYFEDAIKLDPTYVAAYSGLADCNSGLTWHGFRAPADALPKASAAARKAIEINSQSVEAHASLALALSHSWQWAAAEAEFKRALELDPEYANTHHWYGDYLSIRGRHAEALSEARRALELDPLNLMISTWVGLRFYLARNYSAAIVQNRDSVELDPNFAAAHLLLGEGYVQSGTYDAGVNELRQAATLSGGSPLYTAQVGVALAAAGRRREALAIANALQVASSQRYVSPYGLAQIYAAIQSGDETFRWLQAAYDDRAVWMGYLAVDPLFDRYRSDRRFQDLLKRVGLP